MVKTSKTFEVLVGNMKLMNHFKILDEYCQIAKNIDYLEEEGKTVVVLVIDKVP